MAKSEKRAVHMQGVREKILTTAEKLFLSQGYKNTTIRQIVQMSGITSGSIYNIFEDKEHLFSALVDKFMDIIQDSVDKELKGEDGLHRLAGLIYVELYCAQLNPVMREMMAASHVSPILLEDIIARHERVIYAVTGNTKQDESFRSDLLLAEGSVGAYLFAFEFNVKPNPSVLREKVVCDVFRAMGLEAEEIALLIRFVREKEPVWKKIAGSILKPSDV
ncbi:TetR/AcrR family transcriptional regulator [uncultured Dialister sp.]|uniref:TetR/AcrR family transcriptional regulator n=1 Tax=uncultured Dialister sp. TaxID=278064 RepID=UPI0025D625B9|nr:TetR/AcrR family transcriptional regulator [uncultured Dialister sp.]